MLEKHALHFTLFAMSKDKSQHNKHIQMAESSVAACLPLDILSSRVDTSRCPADEPTSCVECWGDKSVRILILGAGGIGCELIHLVACSGFTNIDIIDLDTVDVTNLNRQFLFRESDIGKYKADVAAARIRARFPHITVNSHSCKVQEKELSFFQQFAFFLVGVDNVEARRWMNAMAASLIKWELNPDYVGNFAAQQAVRDEFNSKLSQISAGVGSIAATDFPFRTLEYRHAEDTSPAALIDCGSEAVKGHAKTVLFGKTECVDCDKTIFSKSKVIPLCTLESIPRTAEHCVLYVQQRTWEVASPFKDEVDGETRPSKLDNDNHDHIAWVTEQAKARQAQFSIPGVIDFTFAQGVVKNSIPTIGFTNAMTAAAAVGEMFKLLTAMGTAGPGMVYFDGKRGLSWTSAPSRCLASCETCMPLRHVAIDLSTASIADTLVALQHHTDVQKIIKATFDKKPTQNFGESIVAVHSSDANASAAPFHLTEDGTHVVANLSDEVLKRRDNPFSLHFDLTVYMSSYSPSIGITAPNAPVSSLENLALRQQLDSALMRQFKSGGEEFRVQALEFTTPYLSVTCAGNAIRVHVITN